MWNFLIPVCLLNYWWLWANTNCIKDTRVAPEPVTECVLWPCITIRKVAILLQPITAKKTMKSASVIHAVLCSWTHAPSINYLLRCAASVSVTIVSTSKDQFEKCLRYQSSRTIKYIKRQKPHMHLLQIKNLCHSLINRDWRLSDYLP